MTPLPPALLSPSAEVEEWVGDVATVEPDALPERAQAWRIDGTGSAAWAMAKVAEAEAAIEEITAQAVEWYGRIDEWLKDQGAPHLRTKAFFEAHLERFALDQREADPKRKSLVLPGGKVSTTAKSAKVIVTDEPELIQWAQSHAPEVVTERTMTSVSLSELRRVVKARKLLTLAWVTNSCGCKVSVRDDEGLTIPDVGTAVECSECGQEALIGKVEELAYRWLATTEDGAHVPGVDVQPDEVTAKVVLG